MVVVHVNNHWRTVVLKTAIITRRTEPNRTEPNRTEIFHQSMTESASMDKETTYIQHRLWQKTKILWKYNTIIRHFLYLSYFIFITAFFIKWLLRWYDIYIIFLRLYHFEHITYKDHRLLFCMDTFLTKIRRILHCSARHKMQIFSLISIQVLSQVNSDESNAFFVLFRCIIRMISLT